MAPYVVTRPSGMAATTAKTRDLNRTTPPDLAIRISFTCLPERDGVRCPPLSKARAIPSARPRTVCLAHSCRAGRAEVSSAGRERGSKFVIQLPSTASYGIASARRPARIGCTDSFPEKPPETNRSPQAPTGVPLGKDRFQTPRTPPAFPWSKPGGRPSLVRKGIRLCTQMASPV